MKKFLFVLITATSLNAFSQSCPGFSSQDEANAFAEETTMTALRFLKAKFKSEGFEVGQIAFLGEQVAKGKDTQDCELMTYESQFEVVYKDKNQACLVRGQMVGSSRLQEAVQVQIVEGTVSTPDCRQL